MLMGMGALRAIGQSNEQAGATQYGGPVGGFACNTAGGYSLQQPSCFPQPECMTAASFAAAQAACSAPPSASSSSSSSTGSSGSSQSTGSSSSAGTQQGSNSPATVPSTDIMLGSFDATQFLQTYGVWVIGGVAIIAVIALVK